jgi:hypothetical protein
MLPYLERYEDVKMSKAKVIDITKYLKKRKEDSRSKIPRIYSVKFEVDKEEAQHLTYTVSNKLISETCAGRKLLLDHLNMVVLHLCQEDPSLIIELQESLDEFFGGIEDED